MPIWNQKGVYLGNRANVIFPVTSGLVSYLDAGDSASYPTIKNFVSAKIYSTYNGGLRSSNYTVQYSDDNSTWTTAFSGVATNNTSCGIQQNTGSGSGSYGAHRYWRYVEGAAIASHHPRVSRIILTDINGIDYPFITYTTDNCSDTGTYIVGTVTVDLYITWTDLVSSVNNGTLTNGPVFTSSGSASYFTFDGSNDGVQLAGTNFSLNTMTISCWNYAANYNQSGFMFEKTTNGSVNTQYSFFFDATSTIYYRTYGLSTTDLTVSLSTAGVVNNQWNNLVATFDGTNKRIYRNGTLVATSANLTGTVTQNTTGAAYIGIYGNFAGYPFNGRKSVTRIFNRALTQAEITQDYNFFKGRYGLA